MQQNRLNSLVLMSVENDILQLIKFNDIIDDSAEIKARNKCHPNFQH
jgi:hypothetical protein